MDRRSDQESESWNLATLHSTLRGEYSTLISEWPSFVLSGCCRVRSTSRRTAACLTNTNRSRSTNTKTLPRGPCTPPQGSTRVYPSQSAGWCRVLSFWPIAFPYYLVEVTWQVHADARNLITSTQDSVGFWQTTRQSKDLVEPDRLPCRASEILGNQKSYDTK